MTPEIRNAVQQLTTNSDNTIITLSLSKHPEQNNESESNKNTRK